MTLKVLCLIPALPKDLNPDCEVAIQHQTIPVSKTLLVTDRLKGGTLSSRVSYVLNKALNQIDLTQYDYLLRVDGDTVLKSRWLKTAIESNADLYGGWGYAMLIRIKPFLQVMGGRFNTESDDSYVVYKFKMEGLNVQVTSRFEIDDDMLSTREHKHSKKDQMFCGTIYYKIGYEPLHAFGLLIYNLIWRSRANFSIKDMWLLWTGYMVSFFKQEPKFDFASKIWNYQTKRLTMGRLNAITTTT